MASSSEDLASADEVKVYDDEGDEGRRSSDENLTEDKIGLVTETEQGVKNEHNDENSNVDIKNISKDFRDFHSFPYHPLFYPYQGLGFTGLSQLGTPPPPGLGLYMYGNDRLLPPPAHMGIPPFSSDFKPGFPNPSLYGLPPTAPSPFFPFHPADLASWSALGRIPPLSPAPAFSGPYPLLANSPLPTLCHPLALTSPKHGHNTSPKPIDRRSADPSPQNLLRSRNITDQNDNFHNRFMVHQQHNGLLTTQPLMYHFPNGDRNQNLKTEPKKPVVKKPLNAFMLFMKEMRQSVIDECTLKESAAINQILGRRWHALDRSEQQKYYEMAKKEKELHAQKYPGWSARDNYALHSKKKRRRDHLDTNSSSSHSDGDSSAKQSRLRSDAALPHHWINGYNRETDMSFSENQVPFLNSTSPQTNNTPTVFT